MSALQSRIGRICLTGSAVAAIGFLAMPANADLPGFMMTWDASRDLQNPFTYDPANFGDAYDEGDGLWRYVGQLSNEMWSVDWNVLVDPDPLVDAQIVVTNNADVFQNFSLLMVLNVVPPLADGIARGSNSATVTNEFNLQEGATLRPAGAGSIYRAFIDGGAPFMTLMDDPFSLETDPVPFDTNSATESFDNMPSGPVNNTMAILLEFDLSPGDSASINGFFEIIPGPGGLAIFALLGLGSSRRRRH
jgi:hypothetical protein